MPYAGQAGYTYMFLLFYSSKLQCKGMSYISQVKKFGLKNICIIETNRCTSNRWIEKVDADQVSKTWLLRGIKDFFIKYRYKVLMPY